MEIMEESVKNLKSEEEKERLNILGGEEGKIVLPGHKVGSTNVLIR